MYRAPLVSRLLLAGKVGLQTAGAGGFFRFVQFLAFWALACQDHFTGTLAEFRAWITVWLKRRGYGLFNSARILWVAVWA